jgi:hypothetical protein
MPVAAAAVEYNPSTVMQEAADDFAKVNDSWCTPPEITVPMHDTLFQGPVDVDPCSNDRSLVIARLAFTFGGLTRPWRVPRKPGDRTAFENWPYSQSGAWMAKALYELAQGNVLELLRLGPAMTSTQWWADGCRKSKRNPRIMFTKRISFLDPFSETVGMRRMTCRFEPALIYYGPHVRRFERAFKHLERWSTWGR